MDVFISEDGGVPLYEQIKNQIKDAIFQGNLSDGDVLPSIRAMSGRLKVSVITVIRAYNELEHEGFTVNVQGKGCLVKPHNPELLRERKLMEIRGHLIEAVRSSRVYGLTDSEIMDLLKGCFKPRGIV